VIGPNLSEWALGKRSLVIFLMIVAVVAGTGVLRLGRGEDPVFTFRTMIVAAAWPGATVEETLLQVTERIERKLQETNHLDTVRSYTTAGQTTIFVDLKQSTPPSEVPDVWYQVRKKIGDIRQTLPTSVVGPFFNDDFGDTYGIIYAFTADGFTFRELRDYVEAARSRLLQVPDVSKIEVLGPQDEQILSSLDRALAGLRLDYERSSQPAGANIRPPASSRPARRVFLRVSGASTTSATSRRSTSSPANGSSGSVTSPPCGGVSPIRRSRCSASMAAPRSVSRSRCAMAAISLRSATTSATKWPTSKRICRSASSPPWSPTRRSPSTSRSTIL
jgi:multidrug efflux pump subunit AcrB